MHDSALHACTEDVRDQEVSPGSTSCSKHRTTDAAAAVQKPGRLLLVKLHSITQSAPAEKMLDGGAPSRLQGSLGTWPCRVCDP